MISSWLSGLTEVDKFPCLLVHWALTSVALFTRETAILQKYERNQEQDY
jgi:hypothetical protein